MTDDLKKRLRAVCETSCDPDLPFEAADRIEQLESDVAALNKATDLAIEINNDQVGQIERLEAERDRQLAEAQARIYELTTMCEDLVCEAKDFAYKLEQKTVQLVEAHAALALKDEAIDKYGHNRFCERGIVLSMFKKTERACTCYMREAISIKPDNATLREWGARLLEESGKRMGSRVPSDYADELRSGEWTPEVLK